MRIVTIIPCLAIVAFLYACSGGDATPAPPSGSATEAPPPALEMRSEPVPGRFMVVLNDDERPSGLLVDTLRLAFETLQLNAIAELLLGPVEGGSALLVQVLGSVDDLLLMRTLAAQPGVAYVEQDRLWQFPEAAAATPHALDGAHWGLDRIDQRNLPLDHRFIVNATGIGSNIYFVDTGINRRHNDFSGRIGGGRNFVASADAATADANAYDDCHGHGSHVAGTAAGTQHGVARQATLWAVRTFDCDGAGTTANIAAGIDWVIRQGRQPAIINLNLGGGTSRLLDDLLRVADASGIVTVVAAGNDDADACNDSPQRLAQALTVGATSADDRRSPFSNHGPCVDLMAPGSAITSAWAGSASATRTVSGTSMAAAHATGAAALLLERTPHAPPALIRRQLRESATSGGLNGLAGAPDLLLHVGE